MESIRRETSTNTQTPTPTSITWRRSRLKFPIWEPLTTLDPSPAIPKSMINTISGTSTITTISSTRTLLVESSLSKNKRNLILVSGTLLTPRKLETVGMIILSPHLTTQPISALHTKGIPILMITSTTSESSPPRVNLHSMMLRNRKKPKRNSPKSISTKSTKSSRTTPPWSTNSEGSRRREKTDRKISCQSLSRKT